MNEIARAYWDLAVTYAGHAEDSQTINDTIAYCTQSETALKLAEFACAHPELVLGLDSVPMPQGDTPSQPDPLRTYDSGTQRVSPGPVQGPRLWGAPQ